MLQVTISDKLVVITIMTDYQIHIILFSKQGSCRKAASSAIRNDSCEIKTGTYESEKCMHIMSNFVENRRQT